MKLKRWIAIGLVLLSSVFCFAASTDYKIDNQGRGYFYDVITKGPWADVRAYGAKCDYDSITEQGTDDTIAIQAAINSVKTNGGVVLIPGWSKCLDTISLNDIQGVNIKLVGIGRKVSGIVGAKANYPVIEAVGTSGITLENFGILGDSTNTPSVGLYLGRSTDNANSGHMEFNRLYFLGKFKYGEIYNVSSELNKFSRVYTYPTMTTTHRFSVALVKTNYFSISPRWVTLSAVTSMTACSFYENELSGTGDVPSGSAGVVLEQATNIGFYRTYFSGCIGNSPNKTDVFQLVDGCTDIFVHDTMLEAGAYRYDFNFIGTGSGKVNKNIRVSGYTGAGGEIAYIYSDANCEIRNSYFSNCPYNTAIVLNGVLNSSRFSEMYGLTGFAARGGMIGCYVELPYDCSTFSVTGNNFRNIVKDDRNTITYFADDVDALVDATYYLGAKVKAWKGVVVKDTTNGHYYRIEVISGTLTATDLGT